MLVDFVPITLLSGSSFVSITDNGLNFNKNVLLRMNRPEYVVILLNVQKKQLAIQTCEKNDSNAVAFFKPGSDVKYGVRLHNKDLENMLSSLMNWNLKESNYRIDGTYIEDESAMLFDLNESRQFAKKSIKNKSTL